LNPRIGFGYDLHRLAPGRKLILGGKEIPFSKGSVGHSDGDCLIHAVIDALLGAAGERDIGQNFPDDDPQYKDVRSVRLLVEVMDRIKKKGFRILSLDSVVVAEEPRLSPHVPEMKNVLCPILGLSLDRLGIKAKTNEGLGLIGRGQAIACWAVVLVEKREKRAGKKA
jgi:2-C-methyl-D-erythritol 2,4-cyclodiphosphate synthase